MVPYIALLRGINVSGKNKLKMAELRAALDGMGLQQVQTYIQSGNVLFLHAPASEAALAQRIHQLIRETFELEVPTLVVSLQEWTDIQAGNPFLPSDTIDPSKLHITLLAEPPALAQLEGLDGQQHAPDVFQVVGRTVYLHCPKGYGRTKLTNQFFEQKLQQPATTRNWKTVNKLLELGRSYQG